MSSAIYMKFEEPVEPDKWDAFCAAHKIEYSPYTVGGNIYYFLGNGGVEIRFRPGDIVASTFFMGDAVPAVAEIAARIVKELRASSWTCDPELDELMQHEMMED